MKKIALVFPEYSYPRKNPPLGLAYIAAYLKNKGDFSVVIIDYNVDPDADKKLNEYIDKKQVDIVGISFMTNQFGNANAIAGNIKDSSKDICIIVGGPHASAIPEQTLEEMPSVNIACYGEGEETFFELVKAIRDNTPIDKVPGIAYKKNGVITKNNPRQLITDIDQLPSPAWDLLSLKNYSVFSGDHSTPTFAILSSRGCPSSCVFCDSHTVFARKFRPRSAENIYSEIIFLHENYGMVQFDFVDDLITLKKDRIFELCQLLKKGKILFKWGANARVDSVNYDMLCTMADAGCHTVDFGIESGDPEVRKRLRKKISNTQIINAHKNAQKAGLNTSTFLMVGNLGDTKKSIKMTVDLVKDFVMDANIAIACPYPGTELYKIAKENGWLLVKDWSRYVASPTYFPGYEPIMFTDTMNPSQILDAYYFLHSFFAKRKFQTRYGKYFIFNYYFLKNEVFKSSSQGGQFRKMSMAAKLIKSRFKLR